MPQVSVLSVASHGEAFDTLQHLLKKQTFQDFEFIGEVGEDFPGVWVNVIKKATGDILVFIDSGARPVSDRWLEEMVTSVVDNRTVIKGLEVTGFPLDPSSLAGHRQAFIDQPFDESYPWAEDTELFCRLKENGFRFNQLENAPVIHLSKPGSKTYVKRAFRYGMYRSRMYHRFSKPIELANPILAMKQIIAIFLNQLGTIFGFLFSWIERGDKR